MEGGGEVTAGRRGGGSARPPSEGGGCEVSGERPAGRGTVPLGCGPIRRGPVLLADQYALFVDHSVLFVDALVLVLTLCSICRPACSILIQICSVFRPRDAPEGESRGPGSPDYSHTPTAPADSQTAKRSNGQCDTETSWHRVEGLRLWVGGQREAESMDGESPSEAEQVGVLLWGGERHILIQFLPK
jgi:hypothetical protein